MLAVFLLLIVLAFGGYFVYKKLRPSVPGNLTLPPVAEESAPLPAQPPPVEEVTPPAAAETPAVAQQPAAAARQSPVSKPPAAAKKKAAAPSPGGQPAQQAAPAVAAEPAVREPAPAPVAAAPERSAASAAPAAAPVRPAYSGPQSGSVVWSGQLERDLTLTIDGTAASSGSLLSGALPGVPVIVEVIPSRDIGIVEPPSPSNGWKRISLRSRVKRRTVVTIQWKVTQE